MTKNQSPFALIYGLPLASPAQLLDTTQSRWISSFNISNTLNVQSNSRESLLIDVETIQLNILYDYGFSQNWMLRVQAPLIRHRGGFLDSPIDSYHQALNLPEAQRPDFENDLINIRYSLDDALQTNIDSSQQSLGDISLQIAWQQNSSNTQASSYWFSIKLPSGSAKKLTGSEGIDLATWISTDLQLQPGRWVYAQGGILYMQDGDVLKTIQKNWAAFGNAGIKFEPWENIELKVQLDAHSAMYDSDLEFLDQVIQLTFGGTYRINQQHKLDFAVAEDIKNGASPDVNFNISWSILY